MNILVNNVASCISNKCHVYFTENSFYFTDSTKSGFFFVGWSVCNWGGGMSRFFLSPCSTIKTYASIKNLVVDEIIY